jgi:hypothetical protein
MLKNQAAILYNAIHPKAKLFQVSIFLHAMGESLLFLMWADKPPVKR